MDNKWDYLKDNSDVWCINLINRVDRYNHVKSQFEKIGILNMVKFHQPEKYVGPIRQKGCWDSHRYCLQESLKNNRNALIFEDDVLFDDDWEKMYDAIKESYEKLDWNILRLGGLVYKYDEKKSNHLWSGIFNCTQAYFISLSLIKECLHDNNFSAENYYLSGIDDYYRFECNKDYMLVPQIAWQYNNKSDNEWFQSYNLWQNIMEHKYLYLFNQKTMNKISWYLRYCPNIIKNLNPYVVMSYISDNLHFYFILK
jgi:hypothetical protein